MRTAMCAACIATVLALPLPGQSQATPDTTVNFGLKQFALSAGVLSVVVLAADAPIARALHGAASSGALDVAHQFDHFGDATGIVPIVGGIALVGLVTHKHAVTRTALHAVEAVFLASATTQVGKHIMGRERPYDDPDLDGLDFLHFPSSPAFPSGHTTAAFALATTLGDAVEEPWARVGFFALATGTGLARMAEEEHWLSDVLAGAAIGFVSAKFVSGHYRVFGVRAPKLIIGPQRAGMRWTF